MYLISRGGIWYCTKNHGTNPKLLIFSILYQTHTKILCVYGYPKVIEKYIYKVYSYYTFSLFYHNLGLDRMNFGQKLAHWYQLTLELWDSLWPCILYFWKSYFFGFNAATMKNCYCWFFAFWNFFLEIEIF